MSWCTDDSSINDIVVEKSSPPQPQIPSSISPKSKDTKSDHGIISSDEDGRTAADKDSCPSCGHLILKCKEPQARRINDLPGLPAGVRFDPTDQELVQHLEAKVKPEFHHRLHPLIDEFIPTLKDDNGICYTHPEKLPGVSKDGQVRHFFHRPSKAYTTGTRKRRKVHTGDDDAGCETRWHKTGKTRPVGVVTESASYSSRSTAAAVAVKGYKKILVLYTNYGKQKKPEKTNWVMHQYHLGLHEDEREGELVVSKVFYQTQPRQCGGCRLNKTVLMSSTSTDRGHGSVAAGSSLISFEQRRHGSGSPSMIHHLFPFRSS